MNCPICVDTALNMSNRGSVEIDYCPKCRGVWLDRGELDKIIQESDKRAFQPSYKEQGYEQKQYYNKGYKKKKENWLGELFDF